MKFDRRQLLLYAVTDRAWLDGVPLARRVEEALQGGVTMVQLREKSLDRAHFRAEALEMKALCARYGVPLLINDDVELTREIDADGVHVGQSDLEAGRVREILGPDKIIGVSAKTVEQALAAQAAGADYLGVGAVFPTGTKRDAAELDHAAVRAITAAVDIPAVAIGGINRDNLSQLRGLGLAGAAVVSAIFARPDARAAAEELLALARQIV